MHIPFVDIRAQHTALASEIERAVAAVFERNDWILGREVAQFEEEFAAYCGTEYAIGTDSGLSALELALKACGVGPGDEVITAANTFIATAFAISNTGATPVLVDTDPSTYLMDPALVAESISDKTAAIVPVHLYGHMADMDALCKLAADHGIAIVEDACQAHGARFKRLRAGSFGRAAAFSFYPSKNLGACGDAGAVVTSDPELAERVRRLRNYGEMGKYNHVVKAHNHRLDTLQAAILRVKLRYLDDWNAARREHAACYERLLYGSDLVLPVASDEVEHVWHLYVARVNERDRLRAFLLDEGIETGVHYPVPIHLQPAYADLGLGRGSFPVVESQVPELLSLPMYPELDPRLIEGVVVALERFWVTESGPPAGHARPERVDVPSAHRAR
jgi:dTDP-4-amino-4,6-dideoxygalactose transaminase